MRTKLPLPPSVNHTYGIGIKGSFYKNREAREWEREAGYCLLQYPKFGEKKIVLNIYYYFKNNMSDLGNRSKILQDLLEKQGIINNDNQVYERHEYKDIDHFNSRVEIEIREFID